MVLAGLGIEVLARESQALGAERSAHAADAVGAKRLIEGVPDDVLAAVRYRIHGPESVRVHEVDGL